ncbi:MAG: 1,4-beta-xylanase [Gammaproteobacteria bacterium]|nr:MAG: 1,4-beta-xylanase [Gammaproteobacteria bacterium]
MRVQKVIPILAVSLALTACGGSGGGGSKTSSSKAMTSTSKAISSSVGSDSNPIPSSSSQESISSSSTSSTAETSSSSNSSSAMVIVADMSSGWRGNGTGNTGVTYTIDGVVFDALADNIGAVFDVPKGTVLEKAVIELIVNASSDFKTSGGNLQPFAQALDESAAEWGCWAPNGTIGNATDTTLTCKILEEGRLNQSVADTKVGVQVKPGANPLAGTITIKSAKITLAPASSSSSSYSSYNANVASLKDLADFPIGVAVGNTDSPSTNILTNTQEQAIVEKHFSQMTAGNIMKMSYMHPNNDTGTVADYHFEDADAFVAYAKLKNMSVHAHTLFWHADYQVPTFMKNFAGTPEEFLALVDTHVTTLVDHFEASNNIASWDVVNEALTDDNPSNYRTNSPFYVKSGNSPVFIERAFQAARAADANVDLYYNDYNIENNDAKTVKMMEMVTDFKNRNVPITGVGFQMHVCLRWPSIASISAAMKGVADLGLKVKISELDVAVNQPYCDNYPVNKISEFTPAIALEQKKRYCDIVAAYKAVVPPAQRGGVTVWGTTDAGTWLDGLYASQYEGEKISWPLLFDSRYGDKPALRGFADALQDITCTNL